MKIPGFGSFPHAIAAPVALEGGMLVGKGKGYNCEYTGHAVPSHNRSKCDICLLCFKFVVGKFHSVVIRTLQSCIAGIYCISFDPVVYSCKCSWLA